MISSRNSEGVSSNSHNEHQAQLEAIALQAADDRDRQLFVNILRRQGEDFVKLDLTKSDHPDINSELIIFRIVQLLIKWN